MVKIQDKSYLDHDTSFFLDQPQLLKWNGLPDIQKKKLALAELWNQSQLIKQQQQQKILTDCVQ